MDQGAVTQKIGHPPIAALKAIGVSATIQELDEKVVELESVSEQEQSYTMQSSNSTQPKLNYYLAWARTNLKKGGAIVNSSRGVWAITEKGNSLTTKSRCKDLRQDVVKEERFLASSRRKGNGVETKHSTLSPDNVENILDNSSIKGWRDELLNQLKGMDPSAFERLAQRLLREAGFTKVEVRGKTGDGGIDGVGVLRVNLVSFQVFFQCKRWKGSVGASEIRDFRGAMMGRADKGQFITTGTFTAQASDEATRDGATAIDLIDGHRLCELLKTNGLGVKTEMIESVEIDASWFQAI